MGLGVRWENWPYVLRTLLDGQYAAQAAGRAVEGEIGGVKVMVSPRGSTVGPHHYPYVVEFLGLRLYIMSSDGPIGKKGTVANVRLRIGSEVLIRRGPAVVDQVFKVIGRLGAIVSQGLSRVDPCRDDAHQGLEWIREAVNAGRLVCRARKRAIYLDGSKAEGVQIGTGDIVFRCYDKAAECRENPSKWSAMVQHRWGCEPGKAQRAEFQLRREALRSFGVRTWQDWRDKRREIMAYLTTSWLRVVENRVRHCNYRLVKACAEWVSICTAKRKAQRPKGDEPVERKSVKRLGQQVVGCLVSGVVKIVEGMYASPHEGRAAFRREGQYMVEALLDCGGGMAGFTRRVEEALREACIRRELVTSLDNG